MGCFKLSEEYLGWEREKRRVLHPFNKLDFWVWLGTSYIEWGSHALEELLFPFSASFLCLTCYNISVHNSGWPKRDWDLREQCLLPYSHVHIPIYSFGGGGERECIQYSECASDYKRPFNFLKLSGQSIWGCTAFGQCLKWQMGSGRVRGGDGGCWQGAWKCWHRLQDVGGDVLPVCTYVLTVQDGGHGLCTGGTVCPEHSRGTGTFGGRKGMSHYSAAKWSGQHHLVKGQRARKHHSWEMWNLGPVSKRAVYSWALEGKQPKLSLPPASGLCSIIWCLKTEQWQPWHRGTPQAQAEQGCTRHSSHVLKAAACWWKTVRSQHFLCLSSLSPLPPEIVPRLAS